MENLTYGCSFVLVNVFFMLDFSERIFLHVSLPYFFLISGNAPLTICLVLRSKNIFTNLTISLMYYNNFVFKIVAKILLFQLALRNLIVIWALDDLMLPNNNLSFIANDVKGIQLLNKKLNLIQYFNPIAGRVFLTFERQGEPFLACVRKTAIKTIYFIQITWNLIQHIFGL